MKTRRLLSFLWLFFAMTATAQVQEADIEKAVSNFEKHQFYGKMSDDVLKQYIKVDMMIANFEASVKANNFELADKQQLELKPEKTILLKQVKAKVDAKTADAEFAKAQFVKLQERDLHAKGALKLAKADAELKKSEAELKKSEAELKKSEETLAKSEYLKISTIIGDFADKMVKEAKASPEAEYWSKDIQDEYKKLISLYGKDEKHKSGIDTIKKMYAMK